MDRERYKTSSIGSTRKRCRACGHEQPASRQWCEVCSSTDLEPIGRLEDWLDRHDPALVRMAWIAALAGCAAIVGQAVLR